MFQFLMILSLFSCGYSAKIHIKNPIPGILEKAKEIPSRGVLVQKGNGDVYLDISNDFFTELYPIYYLKLSSIWQRARLSYPSTFNPKGIGAHIVVMTGKELKERGVWYFLKEGGQEYDFSVLKEGYFSYEGYEAKKLHVLLIESAGLQDLRAKYGLIGYPNDEPFHICTVNEHLYEDEY